MRLMERWRKNRREARFARQFGMSRADRQKAAAIAQFYLLDEPAAPALVNRRATEGPQ